MGKNKTQKSKVNPKSKTKKSLASREKREKIQQEICTDKNCPFHGKPTLRGRMFTGTVIKAKMEKTVTVEWPRQFYVPKYERYEKRRSRVKAHNPPCINAREGDKVVIAECRPLSKTKHFVVIEIKERGSEEGK